MAEYQYNDGSKTDVWVKKMIPVLIHWAQNSWDKPHFYSDLANAVGFPSNHVGHFLGCIDDVVKSLGKDIPTLNALVVNKKYGLPSYGFEYVHKDYDNFSINLKKAVAHSANEEAHLYDWGWVLDKLHLKPFEILNRAELDILRNQIKKQVCAGGGESDAHLKLKQYVAEHPEELDIHDVLVADIERQLLSGDRLDVFFETAKEVIAVEVKSHISDETDITRGLFQCVKYKAVLNAEQIFEKTNKDVYSILVMEGTLSEKQKQIAHDLEIEVYEGFNT